MIAVRKRLRFLAIGFISIGLILINTAPVGFAQDDEKLDVGGADTLQTLLAREKGNEVTLRLTSGQEFHGTVVVSGNHLIHLSKLPVNGIADAIIPINKVEAVLFKRKDGL